MSGTLTQMNMGTVFLWATYVVLIMLGLFLKRSRAYGVTVVLFFGLLAWVNTDAADLLGVYMPMYETPRMVQGTEPGWMFLCAIGRALGLTYNGFACIVSVIATALVAHFARKTTPNSSFYLALFLVYPGLISLVQFRQFVATAIAMLGVLALSGEHKHKWLLFAVTILVAFSMHRTAIIIGFVALVFIYQAVSKRARFIMITIIVLCMVAIIMNVRAVGDFFFGEVKTSAYLRATTGDLSSGSGGNASSTVIAAIDVALTLFMCLFVPYCARKLSHDDVEDDRLLGLISFANVMMVALVPLLLITEDFMRFERYGFALALCTFAGMPSLRKRHPLFSCKAFLLLICFAFCWMYAMRGTTFDAVIAPLLSFEYFPPFFA